MKSRKKHHPKGISLLELMIGVVLVSGGIVVMMATFPKMQEMRVESVKRDLATTSAQSFMQTVKSKPYGLVRVTDVGDFASIGDCNCSNPASFDTRYYPPEIIQQGPITLTRRTCVNYVSPSPTDPNQLIDKCPGQDTGLKRLNVMVEW